MQRCSQTDLLGAGRPARVYPHPSNFEGPYGFQHTLHVEVSALKHPGAIGLHARSPLLRLQSDERLVAFVRRGNPHAFETLVSRYQSRLLSFCRHMLTSREDAEDVLQEVFAAAYNAMVADDRPINVRPWLYRIARNRSLNHLRKAQAVGMDSMDVHLSEHGQTTADKAHKREEFRLLMADVQELPETQRSALLLREMDALSYEQIAHVMETTVPSVKSLLVRARVGLAEAAEARMLSCEEVRQELGEVAEGLKRTTAPVRRHVRGCERCQLFRKQLRRTNTSLALLMPVGPLLLVKKLLLAHLGTTAAAGGGGAAAAGGGAAAAGAAGAGLAQAGLGAVATKAAAGLAAAAIVTAGAVEVKHVAQEPAKRPAVEVAAVAPAVPVAVDSEPQPVEALAVSEPVEKARPAERDEAAGADPAAEKSSAPDEAAPTAATPEPGPTQHEKDTTTLPTDYAADTEESSGSTGAAQPAPPATAAQPAPQSSGEESAPASEPESEPEPTPTPHPALDIELPLAPGS